MATLSGIKRTVAQSVGSGIGIYATKEDLPVSNLVVGEQAYVTATSRFYVSNGSGWYNVALVNATPSLTISPTGAITLSSTGETTTITLTATDSDNSVANLTYTVESDGNFSGLGTISQDSSVFTITPLSSDSATTTSSTLTFKASDGINFGSGTRTLSLAFATVNSQYTTLLAKAAGNGGTNTSITDASSNTYTVTVAGDAQATSFSPYRNGGYSYYFDGSGDYLVPSITTAVGTSDFTLEGWFYPTSTASDTTIFDFRSSGNWGIFSILANNTVGYYNGSSSVGITSNTVTDNAWNHIAIVRNSGSVKIYINGILGSTTADTTNWTLAASPRIGGNKGNSAYMNGYISDVRFVNGTAVYTADFTPPTERLTAVTNTELLTCHLPYIADGSTNDYSITINGNVSAKPFAPYDYGSYSASSHGGSVYFDGSGDYLTIPTNTNLQPGSDDFTLECWVYITDIDGSQSSSTLAGMWRNTSGRSWRLNVTGTGYSLEANTSTTVFSGSYDFLNKWTHIAWVKNGSTNTFYINGVSVTSGTLGTYNNSSDVLVIGYNLDGAPASWYFDGHITDFRIVKGTAVYTTDFTPPTSPLSSSGTTLHIIKGTDANVYDASQTTGTLTLSGDAASSTTQTKYASSSIAFDGTGDYIRADDALDGITTSTPFTIECWVYPSVLGSTGANTDDFIGINRASDGLNVLVFSPVQLRWNGSDVTGVTDMSTGQWYHVALVYDGSTARYFINGGLDTTLSGSLGTALEDCTLLIGAEADAANAGSIGNYFNGYLEDIRITKGLSRYPFIPPKETLTAISGTSLLTAHAATITDGSSNSYTITANGSMASPTTFAPKQGMYSQYFDGSNDYLSIVDASMTATGEFTVEGWFYSTSANNTQVIFHWSDISDGNDNDLVLETNGSIRCRVGSGGNTNTTSSTGLWSTNTWHHFAVVRNSSNNVDVFLDGSHIIDHGVRTDDMDNTLEIGRNPYNGGGSYFIGYISNFRIIEGTALYSNSFTPPTAELLG